MNKTAMQQAIDFFEANKETSIINGTLIVIELLKTYIPIEREQIENAFASGFHVTNKTSEDYFITTYEQ